MKFIFSKSFLCSLACVCLATAILAQTPSQPTKAQTPAEKEILARQQAYCDAIVKGDVTFLEQLFTDDFIITSGTGALRDKQAELADLKPTSDFKTLFFKTSDVRVRLYDKTAIVTGRMTWRVSNKGREFDNERRYTSVFVKQKGQWRLASQHVGRVP